MADLIDRQVAMDALDRIGSLDTEADRQYARSFFEALPSAQPDLSGYSDKLWRNAYERGKAEAQQRWIPCSERLPEKGQKCLVCDRGTIAIDTFMGNGKPYDWRWYMRDYDAWMPLPECYREGEE